MKKLLLLLVLFSGHVAADENYRLRMYFGLSLPSGNAVSLKDWQAFEQNQIAKVFDGFNVVDSVGYYQGKPERSKIVTVILSEKDMSKAKSLAKSYAKKFKQDSVMMVKVKVEEWSFETAN